MPKKAPAPHGYHRAFREAASGYYDVDKAIAFLDRPVPPNLFRWRCVLCGWPVDVDKGAQSVIGACCCGGCGMTTLRPIAEWGGPQ